MTHDWVLELPDALVTDDEAYSPPSPYRCTRDGAVVPAPPHRRRPRQPGRELSPNLLTTGGTMQNACCGSGSYERRCGTPPASAGTLTPELFHPDPKTGVLRAGGP
jgi:hypothetical protein